MATPLILVAASGLAREAAAAARAAGAYEPVGVLDDDPGLWGATMAGVKVLGGLAVAADYPDTAFLLCAGRGAVRRDMAARLAEYGIGRDRYATVIHPSVQMDVSSRIDVGCILLAGVTMTADVLVGAHVVCMPQVILTHDDVLADYVTCCAAVTMGGGVRVGAGAYLGMSAAVRERVIIGDSATIGMGAVVLTDVPAGQTWFGVPAGPR